jgi:hypothetical protein
MPMVPETTPIVGTSALSMRERNGAAINSVGFSVYGGLDRARVQCGLASARTPVGLALAANFGTIKRRTTAPTFLERSGFGRY